MVRVLRAGQEQQGLDNAAQPLRFFHRRRQCLAIFIDRARLGERHLDLPAQVVHRCAQLVGDVGAKAAELLKAFLEPIEHAVELFAHCRQFRGHLAGIDPIFQRGRANSPRCGDDALDRADSRARDDVAGDDASHQRHA